jgi:hypothetical protein
MSGVAGQPERSRASETAPSPFGALYPSCYATATGGDDSLDNVTHA